MLKTKIAFEDIKAGDLLEVVVVDSGVKTVLTGIAFNKQDWMPKSQPSRVWWETSEGGMVAVAGEEGGVIYRIDVSEVKFEDIQWGDLIEVSAKRGDVERIIRGKAVNFIRSDASWYDGWHTEEGNLLIRRRNTDKIVVLERKA